MGMYQLPDGTFIDDGFDGSYDGPVEGGGDYGDLSNLSPEDFWGSMPPSDFGGGGGAEGINGNVTYDPSWDYTPAMESLTGGMRTSDPFSTQQDATSVSNWGYDSPSYPDTKFGPSTLDKIMSGFGNAASSGAGQTMGKSAAASAQGRAEEARIQNDLMRNQIARGNMEIGQKQFQVQAPQQRARNSTLGDTLANAQDFQFGASSNPKVKPSQTTGGIRPSNFSAATRSLGQDMSRQALEAQLAGDSFTPVKDPKYPEANWMEKGGTGMAQALSIWDIISQMSTQ